MLSVGTYPLIYPHTILGQGIVSCDGYPLGPATCMFSLLKQYWHILQKCFAIFEVSKFVFSLRPQLSRIISVMITKISMKADFPLNEAKN